MSASPLPPRGPTGFCPQCGYPLDPGRCPECGRWVDNPARLGPEQRRVRRRMRLAGAGAVFLIAVAALFNYRVVAGAALIPARYASTNSAGADWYSRYLREVHDVQWAEYLAFRDSGCGKLHKKIQSELAAGRGPDWAGEYELVATGFGMQLSVAPSGDFAWCAAAHHGWSANRGVISLVGDDHLHLSPHFDEQVFPTGPTRNYIRCTWRKRDYLVPDGDMPWFLNQINSDPRAIFVFALARDAKEPDRGDRFPAAFARFVHREPLTCAITRIDTPTSQLADRGAVHGARIECDAGDRQNVFVGMRLYPTNRVSEYASFVITDVYPSHSVASYSDYCGADATFRPPQIGWRISSQGKAVPCPFSSNSDDDGNLR